MVINEVIIKVEKIFNQGSIGIEGIHLLRLEYWNRDPRFFLRSSNCYRLVLDGGSSRPCNWRFFDYHLCSIPTKALVSRLAASSMPKDQGRSDGRAEVCYLR